MKLKLFLSVLAIIVGLASHTALAANSITFNSFTGIYYLNRDARGLSLLTTEETIVADFPADGYTGITRAIPKKFQGHSVAVKVLNVADAAGNPIPYKTSNDSQGNLVIATGDPAISLYGSQTIKIRYQTSGVINLNKKADELLLNINGRGWDEPYGRVDATLYVPASFGVALKDSPSCYTAQGAVTNNYCRLSVQKTADSTVIHSQAGPLAAHQALILKLDFAPQTFTNNRQRMSIPLLASGLGAIIVVATTTIYVRKRSSV